jgi:hypothetical protein
VLSIQAPLTGHGFDEASRKDSDHHDTERRILILSLPGRTPEGFLAERHEAWGVYAFGEDDPSFGPEAQGIIAPNESSSKKRDCKSSRDRLSCVDVSRRVGQDKD